MEADGSGQGASPPGPLDSSRWEDRQGAYAIVLGLYARMHPRGAAAPGAAVAVAGGGRSPSSAPRAEDGAKSEGGPTGAEAAALGAEAAALGAEATEEGWLRTLWTAFDHEAAAGARLLPAVGAILAASPALAGRMVEWECQRLRKKRPLEDPDTAGGNQGSGGRLHSGTGGTVGGRLARFLPYALEHTTGGGPSPPPPRQAAAWMVRAATSAFKEEKTGGDPAAHPAPWPLLAPFLRAAVQAHCAGADEKSDGARRVLQAALRALVAEGREGDGAGEEARTGWRCMVEGLGAEGGDQGVAPVLEAVRLLRALPAGCRRRALEGIRNWTPAVLDIAARAVMPDAQETAALLALLRRRWPLTPSSLPLPLPLNKPDDNDSGSGSDNDDEGGQQQQGAQTLLELTAAVYRRGGARGPGEVSRLPALVTLFVALQEQRDGEQHARFLGANDSIAYLQAKLLAAILVEDQAAASSIAATQQSPREQQRDKQGLEEGDQGLTDCGPALLRLLLTALIAPRGMWMRRERDVMEALGRMTQILARDRGPSSLLLPPLPTLAAAGEAGGEGRLLVSTSSTGTSSASNRRRSSRRSAALDRVASAKSDDAIVPAPAAAGVTSNVPPAPAAAAPAAAAAAAAAAAGGMLGGDVGLCRRVIAAALALCGEVQDLHRAELALHAPRRTTRSPPPATKRRRLLMPHHSAAPGLQQDRALISAVAACDTEEERGAEQPPQQEGQEQEEADAAMAPMAAAEYEGDRKLAWMMGKAFDIILQVGAAAPILPPPFLTSMFDTIDRRFGAFFEGGDHRLCRPADCPFARPQRLLTFLLGPLRLQLGSHGFLPPHEGPATATAPSGSIHVWREVWAPGLALTLAASKTATGSSSSSSSSSSSHNPLSLSAAASLALASIGVGSSLGSLPPPPPLPSLPALTPQSSGISEPPFFPILTGGQSSGIGIGLAGVGGGATGGSSSSSHAAAAAAAAAAPLRRGGDGGGGNGSPARNFDSHAPRHGRMARGPSAAVGGVGMGSRGPTPPPTPALRLMEAHGGLPGAVEGFLRYLGATTGGARATMGTATAVVADTGGAGKGGGGAGGGVERKAGGEDGRV